MRPIINTKKHFVQQSLFAVASGAILAQEIVLAVADPDATVPQQITEGAKISAVFVEMWLTSDDTGQGSVIITLEKHPGSSNGNMSTADAAALTDYDNKKNILHTQMGLLGPNTQYPMPVVKGWFKIPKSKQRFGLEDRLVLNIFGQSNGVSGCGLFIYKEQF